MRIEPFGIERFFDLHEFSTRHILCASDCESLTVAELLAFEEGSLDRLSRVWLGYTETSGSLQLRTAIASLYREVGPDDIIVHSGGEEVIFTFMLAALRTGDHLIVHQPIYGSLLQLPLALGCEVSAWCARAENEWQLDVDDLAALVRPQTRAIVVNLPHSPTGYLMTKEQQQRLLEFARERDLLVFSDEAYRGLEYQENDRLPAAADLYENAASLGLLSKGYGMPGLRVGWVATRNDRLRKRILEIKDYTTICGAAPSEFLGEIALRHGAALLSRSQRTIAANLPRLETFFAKYEDRFSWVPPRAGPVAFPTLRGPDSVEEFCEAVRKDAGVLLLPGTVFHPESHEFRVGFGRTDMVEALERLDEYLGG